VSCGSGFFFFQAEDGIRDFHVTGVQTLLFRSIASALSMTALVFFGLSAFVLITRKDMSFLSGFITAGFFVLLGAMVASFFFQISGLQLAISAGFVLFSSVCILYQTSAIIHGEVGR